MKQKMQGPRGSHDAGQFRALSKWWGFSDTSSSLGVCFGSILKFVRSPIGVLVFLALSC
jgi:hypothetical protein